MKEGWKKGINKGERGGGGASVRTTPIATNI
jgi:hypothetical protein